MNAPLIPGHGLYSFGPNNQSPHNLIYNTKELKRAGHRNWIFEGLPRLVAKRGGGLEKKFKNHQSLQIYHTVTDPIDWSQSDRDYMGGFYILMRVKGIKVWHNQECYDILKDGGYMYILIPTNEAVTYKKYKTAVTNNPGILY